MQGSDSYGQGLSQSQSQSQSLGYGQGQGQGQGQPKRTSQVQWQDAGEWWFLILVSSGAFRCQPTRGVGLNSRRGEYCAFRLNAISPRARLISQTSHPPTPIAASLLHNLLGQISRRRVSLNDNDESGKEVRIASIIM
jgi:hypothetical protein